MFKRFICISMAVVLMVSVLAGCGASTSKNASTAAAPAAAKSDAGGVDVSFSESMDAVGTAERNGMDGNQYASAETPDQSKTKEGAADSLAGTGNTVENMSNAILAERKIIRSANLSVEVDNFDEAYNNINSIILGIGIIQESNISTDKVYVEDKLKLVKRGTIVLRVNKDKFDSVMNNLKGIGDVYNEVINGQDVTDRFVDTESRLRLLKLEQSRLEAYLMKLEDLDQIFKTESRLTEIRQEIESLTGNLTKMSSLVELSTITLTMNEKHPGSDQKPKPETYGQKLLNNLKSSLEGVVTFLGELLIILVAAIPILIMLGLFVLLGLFIYRRIPKRPKKTVTAFVKESMTEKENVAVGENTTENKNE